MNLFLRLIIAVCICFFPNNTFGQIPNLVKDIYVGINQSNSALQGIAYSTGILLNANDGIAGSELWFSNGSNPGTVLVKDINPGGAGSAPGSFLQLGSKILFVANNGTNGTELWITDNTLAGTVIVKDINPGSASSAPSNFTVFGSKILFLAITATEGKELWITDGTTAGTTLVKDIWPGVSNSNIVQITNSGLGYIYFVANDGVAGEELWKSDGTTGGTMLIKDILVGTGYSNTQIFKMAGPNLYFAADNGSVGKELWKSDGTTGGTALVKDFIPGLTGTFTVGIPTSIAYNNKLFFVVSEPVNGTELWESDGTTGGTIVNNISTGTVSTTFHSDFYIYNNELFFFRRVFKPTNKDTCMFYKIVNNVTNASLLKKFFGAPVVWGAKFDFWQTNNSKFIAKSGCSSTSADCFFVSDGTAGGSFIAADSIYCAFTDNIPFINNAWIYPVAKANDYELMNIDYNTGANTQVKNINPTQNFNTTLGKGGGWNYKNYFFNNNYYLLADDGTTGLELWVTDGGTGTTNLLLDIYPGMNGGPVSILGDFTAIVTSNNMFFYANDGFTGRELWALGGFSAVNENQNKMLDNIFVYPNPATDDLHFNVSTEYFAKNKTEYFIYNSIGQICGEGQINENKINVAKLADGFYTMNLKSENGITTLKFVKN